MKAGTLAMLWLAGCAAPRGYLGVDPRGPGDTAMQEAAARATTGDKSAMLRLGGYFEEHGDLDRACRAYRDASATTGGTTYIYSPPVRKGGSGRLIPVTTPLRPGLALARERRTVLAYRASSAEKAASDCLRTAP